MKNKKQIVHFGKTPKVLLTLGLDDPHTFSFAKSKYSREKIYKRITKEYQKAFEKSAWCKKLRQIKIIALVFDRNSKVYRVHGDVHD